MCRCAASSFLWLLTLLATSTGALDKPDISWGDWIIIEDSAPADSGASILLRRITPKSVFVAPSFGCPEGYRQDALGRCVKLVQVNKQAQWNFFLEKLNSMYAPTPSQGNKESGPFHISLPIGSASVKEKPVTTTTKQTTPITTALLDTDISSTVEDLITTIKVDRDTTKIEQENASTTDRETTFEHETPTKTVQETTTVSTPDQETTNSSSFDQQTTRTDSETTKGTTILQETLSTTKNDQETTTNSESTVNMKEFENETEINLQESKRKEIVQFVEVIPQKEDSSETVKRPFIIVVTGQPETTTVTMTTGDEATTTTSAESVSETSVSKEVTERESETVTIEPVQVKLPNSVKSKCDLSVQVTQLRDELGSNIDCEPVFDSLPLTTTPLITPPTTLNPPLLTLPPVSLEPYSQVRFPSESNVPVRKTSSFVRFPEDGRLWHNTRQPFRWPLSWEYQKHPDIMAWPPMEKPSSSYHHYSPQSSIHHTQSWSNSPPWHRRIIQRD